MEGKEDGKKGMKFRQVLEAHLVVTLALGPQLKITINNNSTNYFDEGVKRP